MKWETNVLLLPAYLAPGVSVTCTVADRPRQDGAEDEGPPPAEDESLGSFDGGNEREVWYLRAGVDVALHVAAADGAGEGKDGDGAGKDGEGVAAVFVVGVLCTETHAGGGGGAVD